MYTELYLAVDLKKEIPKELIEEIKSEDGRFWGVGCTSYYFGGLSVFDLKYDEIQDCYKLTMRFNMKNYDNEIEEMIKLILPYIDNYGHIGHKRYEETDMPTLLFCTDENKIIELTPVFEKTKGGF